MDQSLRLVTGTVLGEMRAGDFLELLEDTRPQNQEVRRSPRGKAQRNCPHAHRCEGLEPKTNEVSSKLTDFSTEAAETNTQ